MGPWGFRVEGSQVQGLGLYMEFQVSEVSEIEGSGLRVTDIIWGFPKLGDPYLGVLK